HKAGDTVLQRFAGVAAATLRGNDYIGRVGGEEFCILVPGVTSATAIAIAERVRREFAASRIEHDGVVIPATVSAGGASLGDENRDFDQLLSAADRALYGAKRGGRDRVFTTALALAG